MGVDPDHATDFPHIECDWPNAPVRRTAVADVAAHEAFKIAAGNVRLHDTPVGKKVLTGAPR
jgi:hypothetical protein